MEQYRYTKLDTDTNEVRLLELLPGEFDDDLRMTLTHHPLVIYDKAEPRTKILKNELQRTLPSGWTVWETIEDRFLFGLDRGPDEDYYFSWTHPVTEIDRNVYDPPYDHAPAFEPTYEALSYVWGSQHDQQAVHIGSDSDPCQTILRVNQNLACALRYLRDREIPRRMWIDAICINQQDVKERGEQVRRMSDIFKMAYRVVVWLGSEARYPTIRLAFSALDLLAAQVECLRNGFLLALPDCSHPDWFSSSIDLPFDDSTWQSIVHLFDCDWFERLWVWQEIKLADNRLSIMKCGNHEVSLPRLRRAVACLNAKLNLPPPRLGDCIRHHAPLLEVLSRSQPFPYTLSQIARRNCSEPKDKVYGALGVAPSSVVSRIVPLYSKSVEEVYKDIFLACVNGSGRLELLNCCDSAIRRTRAPSWVPDWLSRDWARIPLSFCSSSISLAQATSVQCDVLRVQGVRYGTIQSVSEEASEDLAGISATVRAWEPENSRTRFYSTGENLLDAYTRTLAKDELKERFPWTDYPTLDEWKDLYLAQTSNSTPNSKKDQSHDRHWRARFVARGCCFITTEDGYFGLAPPGPQRGNICSLI